VFGVYRSEFRVPDSVARRLCGRFGASTYRRVGESAYRREGNVGRANSFREAGQMSLLELAAFLGYPAARMNLALLWCGSSYRIAC
jgi:hypothetical protein